MPLQRSSASPEDAYEERIFRPVVDSRAHELVIDQITFGIRAGVHKVGEKLPPIGELARQFGVSKPTVGEAVRILALHGVVVSKRGVTGGVTVASDDIPTALLGLVPERRQTDLRELLEARRAVEMEIAQLAGRRADEADVAAMRDSIERLEENLRGPGRLRLHYDHLFHYAMGRAARSDLLAYYQHQILKQLVVLLSDYFLEHEDPLLVLDLHRRTLKALVGGRPKVVERVMDEHLAVLEGAAVEMPTTFALGS
jgi:GntR family transcriptional repressor for pyruvate dehydrogenase complex